MHTVAPNPGLEPHPNPGPDPACARAQTIRKEQQKSGKMFRGMFSKVYHGVWVEELNNNSPASIYSCV